MHQQAFDYFKRWIKPTANHHILEVGSYDVNSTTQGLLLRSLAKNVVWIGVDIKTGPNVDKVLEQGEKWPFRNEFFDWVLLPEIIEHDVDPKFTIREAFRTLKVQGKLILTTAGGNRKHHNPPHYWNFWPESLYFMVTEADLKVHHLELIDKDIRCYAIKSNR